MTPQDRAVTWDQTVTSTTALRQSLPANVYLSRAAEGEFVRAHFVSLPRSRAVSTGRRDDIAVAVSLLQIAGWVHFWVRQNGGPEVSVAIRY
jgi:hypothetical protein